MERQDQPAEYVIASAERKIITGASASARSGATEQPSEGQLMASKVQRPAVYTAPTAKPNDRKATGSGELVITDGIYINAEGEDASSGTTLARLSVLAKNSFPDSVLSLTSLAERQIIDLPLPDEVVEFYRCGRSVQFKNHVLITEISKTTLDNELDFAQQAAAISRSKITAVHPL